MKSRIPLAALAAAFALWLMPTPATSTRIPTRPHESFNDLIESDPWVPDGRDPARIIPLDYQEDSVDSRTTTPSRSTAFQESWTWRILRALRVLYVGGLLR